MRLTLGLAVVVGILVVLPLAAVWASHHWRDPPPERWGLPATARAAAEEDPFVAEWTLRGRLGLSDDDRWRDANRAIRRGEAAPPELRTAIEELAGLRIAELDRRIARSRRPRNVPLALALLAASIAGYVYLFLHGLGILLAYQAFWVVRAIAATPWWLRRRRARAEAAVLASA